MRRDSRSREDEVTRHIRNSHGRAAFVFALFVLKYFRFYYPACCFFTADVALVCKSGCAPLAVLSGICVNLNLPHRQGRGRSAAQGWQVKATAEGPLCPRCSVCGTAQQGLPSTNCPLCNQEHPLSVFQGNHYYWFVLWSTKGYLS